LKVSNKKDKFHTFHLQGVTIKETEIDSSNGYIEKKNKGESDTT
jgi:hypothetical protein